MGLFSSLQSQAQPILNVMHLDSCTKIRIQKFGGQKDGLLITVISIYEKHNINIPNMNDRYVVRYSQACHQQENFRNEHHYRVDIFNVGIDS